MAAPRVRRRHFRHPNCAGWDHDVAQSGLADRTNEGVVRTNGHHRSLPDDHRCCRDLAPEARRFVAIRAAAGRSADCHRASSGCRGLVPSPFARKCPPVDHHPRVLAAHPQQDALLGQGDPRRAFPASVARRFQPRRRFRLRSPPSDGVLSAPHAACRPIHAAVSCRPGPVHRLLRSPLRQPSDVSVSRALSVPH